MKPGKAKDIIVIDRQNGTTSDDYGGEIENWVALCSPYAEINYGKGEERRNAAQESASLTATFRVRANPVTADVKPKDRIQFAGAAWDITSNAPWQRSDRDITATRQS